MDINLVIAISLAVLAVCTFCILILIVPVALQCHKTLNSIQHLVDVINDDLGPTVKEIKSGIDEVKNTVQKYTSPVKSTFNKVSVAVISSAHGILTGIKKYVSEYKKNGNGSQF